MLYGLKTGLEPFLFFMPAILVISAKNASRDCPFGTAPTPGKLTSRALSLSKGAKVEAG